MPLSAIPLVDVRLLLHVQLEDVLLVVLHVLREKMFFSRLLLLLLSQLCGNWMLLPPVTESAELRRCLVEGPCGPLLRFPPSPQAVRFH